MSDLLFQNISTVQNKVQPGPVTLAAAATIAPSTFLTHITGATAIATITPPVTGTHMLCLVATETNLATVTTGNINAVVALGAGLATLFVYNPLTRKYYPSYAVAPD